MTASILRTPEQPSALLVCAVPARGPQGLYRNHRKFRLHQPLV